MSGPARSAFYFGFYPFAAGLALLLFADRLLPTFGFATSDYLWARLVGAVSMSLGYYYWEAGRRNQVAFIRWSVLGRAWVVACMAGLVLLGQAKLPLLLFGLGDIAGLTWSWLALRREHGS